MGESVVTPPTPWRVRNQIRVVVVEQTPGHSTSLSHRAIEQPLCIHGHVVTQLGTLDGDHTEPHGDQVEVGWGWREAASSPGASDPQPQAPHSPVLRFPLGGKEPEKTPEAGTGRPLPSPTLCPFPPSSRVPLSLKELVSSGVPWMLPSGFAWR